MLLLFLPWRSSEDKPQGLSVKTEHAEVTVIPDRPRDSQTSDSDSDGPILYRDEEEEEEEEDDEYTNSMASVYQHIIFMLFEEFL